MNVIEINHVTKDYGNQKGVFDISFTVEKGEVLGFLGPNGSGKTTTIRQLMGFIHPDQGNVSILDKDCFQDADIIQKSVGYLPGEIAFMDEMTGDEFIHFIAKLKNINNMQHVNELIDFLELDPRGKMKKMSKGMKQKIGLVIAFMQDAPILILDEPTSGLDPLMQNKFVELIQKAKKEGKTVLMSSHIFEEVENTCDRVIMIKDGKMIANETMENIKNQKHKHYDIVFVNDEEAIDFTKKYSCERHENKVSLQYSGDINVLIQQLSQYHLIDFNTRVQTLEELFLHYYGGDQ